MEILFVCTGNTCRSTMAEAIFNSINTYDTFHSTSAGIFAIKGSKASENTVEVVKEYLDVDIKDRYAVQLTKEMIQKSDLVLAMTKDIKNMLCGSYNDFNSKIFTLNEYVSVKGCITDPYGGDKTVYEQTYFQIKNSIIDLINKLKEGGSIY